MTADFDISSDNIKIHIKQNNYCSIIFTAVPVGERMCKNRQLLAKLLATEECRLCLFLFC